MSFTKKFQNCSKKNKSYLCVGLDTDINKLPENIKNGKDSLFTFNKEIIDATKDIVCAYKPNYAFYSAHGREGLDALKKTINYIPDDIPVILDAKVNDIGNTAKMYAKTVFTEFEADAVTYNPYMGSDTIDPFLEYKDRGVISLCLTSNPGSKDFQYLNVDGKPLYQRVMEKLVEWKSKKSEEICAVVGATHPDEIKLLRNIAPDMIFLIPGVGSQGGDVKKVVENAKISRQLGIINVSRKIIYADNGANFAEEARKAALNYKDMINSYL